MRRQTLKRIALALLLVNAWIWAPGLPPVPDLTVAQVRAQSFAPIPASGVIAYSMASIAAVNSTSEFSMFQFTLSPGLLASATSVGAVGSPVYTAASASGLSTTPLWTTPAGIHFRAIGAIAGLANTTLNLGINFGTTFGGGSLGSIVVNNIIPTSITTSPPGAMAKLDVWLTPLASTNATPNANNNYMLTARFEFPIGGTNTTVNASQAIVNIISASPSQLNVVARWGAAAVTSSYVMYNRLLKIAE